MKNQLIFLDGKWVNAKTALLESLTPGVVEGKGVFETMRVEQGRILVLEEHFERLQRGCRLYEIKLPYALKKIKALLDEVIVRNSLKNARIRLSVWRQSTSNALISGGAKRAEEHYSSMFEHVQPPQKSGRRENHIAIVAQGIKEISSRQYQRGFHAMISSVYRPKTRFAYIKSLDYHVFRQALKEARGKGFEEAIVLNSQKEIVEGATTNIFFVKKNILYTPAIRCGCLNGITRQQVILCARQLGIPCQRVFAEAAQLLKAKEAFVTNSLLGVMPLTRVNQKAIGSGKIGKVTKQLLKKYWENLKISGCSLGQDCL